ncbi:hypothetical protein [Cesiribacter sp. SM1]|uniref:hypothetical protein n=1 Tax=Cesiribacter sp. SM1 TaxID=2861196 RepID=UPI001CD281D8|nr:hypothetical protein [Cesiribacter sp. SM1]
MNKLLYPLFSFLLIASVVLTTSCGTDDDEVTANRPSFTITGIDDVTGTTADVGEPVTFTVNVTAPGGFNVLRVYKTVGEDGNREMIAEESRTAGQTTQNHVYSFTYTPIAAEAGQMVYFDFEAVDDAGLDNTYEYIVTVNEQPLVAYEQELLYAPLESGASETWFSTTNGETYTSNEVNNTQQAISNLIDFGYFYGVTREATLASPENFPTAAGQASWNVRNNTKLKKTELASSAFFEATSAATIQQAYENATFGTNEEQATNLEVGDVIVFMTDPDNTGGSRMGMIHVADIVEGAGNTGRIMLNVKVMP